SDLQTHPGPSLDLQEPSRQHDPGEFEQRDENGVHDDRVRERFDPSVARDGAQEDEHDHDAGNGVAERVEQRRVACHQQETDGHVAVRVERTGEPSGLRVAPFVAIVVGGRAGWPIAGTARSFAVGRRRREDDAEDQHVPACEVRLRRRIDDQNEPHALLDGESGEEEQEDHRKVGMYRASVGSKARRGCGHGASLELSAAGHPATPIRSDKLVNRSFSSWTSVRSSLPVRTAGTRPTASRASTTAGSSAIARTASANLFVMSAGSPVGAEMPTQYCMSRSGWPSSAVLGTSGSSLTGSSPVSAIGLSSPVLLRLNAELAPPAPKSMSPAATARITSPELLNGTRLTFAASIPASSRN